MRKYRQIEISLDRAVTESSDNDEFMKLFKNFSITATEQDINEFVAIDDKTSNLNHEEILEEQTFFLKNNKQ